MSGSKGRSYQPQQYRNASARHEPWTPYPVSTKRTGKVASQLDASLTVLKKAGVA
jgi:hypothetical protein